MAELFAADPTTLDVARRSVPGVGLPRRSPWEQTQERLDAATLVLARERFAKAAEAEGTWREKALQDRRFAGGEQWEEMWRRSRNDPQNPRPCLTINQLPRFIRQVTNAQRQNRPAIAVHPRGYGASANVAKVLRGLLRQIEVDSHADLAYDTGMEGATTEGRGFWRIITQYLSPWEFAQQLAIERIMNPMAVYLDPTGRRDPDYHRMQWAFVVDTVAKDELCDQYRISATTYSAWESKGDTWVNKDECKVADYYYLEQVPFLLVQLTDGQRRYVSLVEPAEEALDAEGAPTTAQQQEYFLSLRLLQRGVLPLSPDEVRFVAQERDSTLPMLHWDKINGHTILERCIWPGQYVPIVPVLGNEVLDDQGQYDYQGIVRNAIDAQRMYNYWRSQEAETIALAPKSPYIGAGSQFKNHEHEWGSANTTPRAYLQYEPMAIGGQLLPPPQRQAIEPPIQAMSAAASQASQDLYNTIGIMPADLGEPSNEKSGRAIAQRKAESELGSSHFQGNLARAIRHTGRILVDLIPFVYTEPGRILDLLHPDETRTKIMLHPNAQTEDSQISLSEGIEGVYNLSQGEYLVTIDTGPSVQTQRQETANNLLDLAKVIPQVGQVGADLIVATQDFEGAEELAQRLKRGLPPQVIGAPDDKAKPEQILPMLQAQLAQLQQQSQQMHAYAQQLEQRLQQAMAQNHDLQMAHDLKLREIAVQEYEAQLKAREIELRAQAEVIKAQLAVQGDRIDAARNGY